MANILEIDYAELCYFQEVISKKFYIWFTCKSPVLRIRKDTFINPGYH